MDINDARTLDRLDQARLLQYGAALQAILGVDLRKVMAEATPRMRPSPDRKRWKLDITLVLTNTEAMQILEATNQPRTNLGG